MLLAGALGAALGGFVLAACNISVAPQNQGDEECLTVFEQCVSRGEDADRCAAQLGVCTGDDSVGETGSDVPGCYEGFGECLDAGGGDEQCAVILAECAGDESTTSGGPPPGCEQQVRECLEATMDVDACREVIEWCYGDAEDSGTSVGTGEPPNACEAQHAECIQGDDPDGYPAGYCEQQYQDCVGEPPIDLEECQADGSHVLRAAHPRRTATACTPSARVRTISACAVSATATTPVRTLSSATNPCRCAKAPSHRRRRRATSSTMSVLATRPTIPRRVKVSFCSATGSSPTFSATRSSASALTSCTRSSCVSRGWSFATTVCSTAAAAI